MSTRYQLAVLTFLATASSTALALGQEGPNVTKVSPPSRQIMTQEQFIELVGVERFQQLEVLAASKSGEPLTPDEVRAILGPEKMDLFNRIANEWSRKQAENSDLPQRKALQEQVQAIRRRTMEETVASLQSRSGIDDEIYTVASSAGIQLNRIGAGEVNSLKCLADKRVARIYHHLKELPSEEANRKCQEIFEQNLKALNDGLDTWFGLAELPPADRKPISRHDHALRSTVLLSAIFCDGQTLLAQIDRWKTRNLLRQGRVLLTAEHKLPALDFIISYGEPDPLFITHLLMIKLQLEGRLTPAVLEKGQELGLPETRLVSLIKWDAEYGASESIFSKALDADDSRLEKNFILTHSWGVSAYNSLEKQNQVVACLRGVLAQPADVPSDPQPTPAAPQN